MTKHVDVAGLRFVTIEAEPSRVCQQCGKVAETRPYGKGGIQVCFECGMADEAETIKQFTARITGREE